MNKIELAKQFRALASLNINTLDLKPQEALKVSSFYPQWKNFINTKLDPAENKYVQYNDELWEVINIVNPVLEHQPPSLETSSLYKRVDLEHAGTQEDPIPFAVPMEVFEGKYYIYEEVIYKCTRNSEIALNYPPAQLIGHYFETVE